MLAPAISSVPTLLTAPSGAHQLAPLLRHCCSALLTRGKKQSYLSLTIPLLMNNEPSIRENHSSMVVVIIHLNITSINESSQLKLLAQRRDDEGRVGRMSTEEGGRAQKREDEHI